VASRAGFENLRATFLEAHEIGTIQPLMADLLLQRFVQPDPSSYDALRSGYETAMQYWRERPLAASVHPAFLFR
jgi:hypothetical protein